VTAPTCNAHFKSLMAQTKVKRHDHAPVAIPPLWGLKNVIQWLRQILAMFFIATALPVLVVRWVPPPTSMFMLTARVAAFMQGDHNFRIHYDWVPWQEISAEAKLAVVASEDQTFAHHLGFDFKAMEQALIKNRSGQKIRGASTISQQTAKNLFLHAGRSYSRKLLEAYFTALIEFSWPKQRILEVYLNIAEFGKGIYGVEAAGRSYFGKSAAQIGGPEAALLAAVLPNPIQLRVDRPSAYVLQRRRWILQQMRQLGGKHYLDEL
jgi:monofunctional biosynthetic peptidoglycan transglycosylase